MSFRMSPIGLVDEIRLQVNTIRQQLLGQDPPSTLFHYTKLPGVVGITNSRIVRAMSVASLDDNHEIHHGVNLVEAEVNRKSLGEISQTAKAVLEHVGDHLRNRISRTFTTCFCANPSSEFHWKTYGSYCLRFETNANREPLLRVSVSGAQVGYYKAIYGVDSQQNSIESALGSVVSAIDRHTRGILTGYWAEPLIHFIARNVSELLLDIIVAFKKAEFAEDAEWRLVVRPYSALASSAPNIADHNFDVLVRREAREFVELQELRRPMPFQSLALRSPVPFIEVIQSPFCDDPKELEIIQELLGQNGRADIRVVKSSK